MMQPATLQPVPEGSAAAFEMFNYPAVAAPPMPSWEAFGSSESVAFGHEASQPVFRGTCDAAEDKRSNAAFEARLAEEVRRAFEAGRERGLHEGRAAEREAWAANAKAKDAARIEQAARLAEGFHAERARYFDAVEHEVVKLALAVAARILRRESQMDALLLSGAVRVALGQLSGSTQVGLRVPPDDLELWKDTIAHLPNLAVKPTVVGGEGMRLGECVLETELGSVNLGVAAQLGEIERGFFDRAGQNSTSSRTTEIAEDMSE
jgi:flagellar assembly protein FliH